MFTVNTKNWEDGSQVIWIDGTIISKTHHKKMWNATFNWLPVSEKQAFSIARNNQTFLYRFVELLISWRTLSHSQLALFLPDMNVPPFTMDTVNFYGALTRLGLVRVGFLFSQMLSGTISEIFFALCPDTSYNTTTLRRIGLRDNLTHNYLLQRGASSSHIAVKHNTYTAHLAINLYNDSRIRAIGGDGIGGFRYFDPTHTVNQTASMDAAIFPRTGGIIGIETQSTGYVHEKINRWITFLTTTPDIICLWVLIPKTAHYTLNPKVFQNYQTDPRMLSNNIGHRLYWVRWDEWFNPDGTQHANMLGTAHDFLGNTTNILTHPFGTPWDWTVANTWLWDSICTTVNTRYHLDITSMKQPAITLNPGLGLFHVKRT